jgi:hypothetical protein
LLLGLQQMRRLRVCTRRIHVSGLRSGAVAAPGQAVVLRPATRVHALGQPLCHCAGGHLLPGDHPHHRGGRPLY